jgi:hypothetical protein
MSKVWTLDQLEQLPEDELTALIPDDIDKQFDRLPIHRRLIKSKAKIDGRGFYKGVSCKSGHIRLLNGDTLFVKDCSVGEHYIRGI